MKVEFKRTFEFLQHTGSPRVFPCGIDANAPDELMNDAAFLFQKDHGVVVVIAEPKAEVPATVELEPSPVTEPKAEVPILKKGKK